MLQCFAWYAKILASLPERESQNWASLVAEVVNQSLSTAPPAEWMEYIMEKLALIDSGEYQERTTLLITRSACNASPL